MSRRTKLSALVLVALVASYYGVTGWVRAHVNELIAHSIGKPLPEFALADRTGKAWTTAELKGKRAVLHFFRSFCHSCDVEAEAVRAFEPQLAGDTVLLHVMTDAVLNFAPAKTQETLAQKNFTRPVLMADAAFVDAFHQVRWSNVTPVTYVVDAAGVVRFGLRGAQTLAQLKAALAAAK